MNPPAVNFHICCDCNYACLHCFAPAVPRREVLRLEEVTQLLRRLHEAGVEKLNFAGGEPTLYADLGEALQVARRLGFVVSIITNGAKLRPVLAAHAADLDWVGLSADSADEAVQAALGRGRGGHVARTVGLFDVLHELGLRTKLNTVVTSLNWQEDMSAFVRRVRPARWKVFQVLPVVGQNDARVVPLLISADQLRAFAARHVGLRAEGLAPVVEDNEAMTGSYVMVDPAGRFFNNSTGRYVYSEPILRVGVAAALAQVGWDADAFVRRGGLYDWRRRVAVCA